MEVPREYRGREQALIKHRLLGAYLERLFMIIGLSEANLCYVDCFAGPWQEGTDDLGDTSIGISLAILKKASEGLSKMGRKVRCRALFVEGDPKSFEKLTKYLKTSAPAGIETEAFNGQFLDLRHDVIKWTSTDFAFFFIDPKGWKDVSIPTLGPFLARPRSELLITFMYDFVSRFVGLPEYGEVMKGLFGSVPEVKGLAAKRRERMLLRYYRENLKVNSEKGARTAYANILDPGRDRTKYHLVYVTRHPLGIVKFMEASEELDLVQPSIRALAKQQRRIERTGQTELFRADELPDSSLERKWEELDNIEDAKRLWQRRLKANPTHYGIPQLAQILEATGWFPRHVQTAFRELEDAGLVQNLDAKKKRPKNPVNFYKNERLILL